MPGTKSEGLQKALKLARTGKMDFETALDREAKAQRHARAQRSRATSPQRVCTMALQDACICAPCRSRSAWAEALEAARARLAARHSTQQHEPDAAERLQAPCAASRAPPAHNLTELGECAKWRQCSMSLRWRCLDVDEGTARLARSFLFIFRASAPSKRSRKATGRSGAPQPD